MTLNDIAKDIMEKYDRKYQQIKDTLERDLKNNKQYNDKVRKERNQQAKERALKKAETLKEDYMNDLEKRLEDREQQYKRQWERELAAEESKSVEEKTLDTMQLLLTQQIVNGGNSQQIRDHLMDHLENRKVVEMMSYHYSNKEGADQIRNKINETLASPLDHIERLKGQVRVKKANSDLIDFGGVQHIISRDIEGNHAKEFYFGG